MKEINFDEIPDCGDRYIVADCIGYGVYGKVYAASDTQASGRKVAIKLQKLNENTSNYVKQEYRILRDFSNHPNLCDFYGIYRRSNEIWFVMEICESGPVLNLVWDLLRKNRRMVEEHIAYILKETVKALIFLHENNIIHRDVKASNILLTRDGEVKLIDFGLSHVLANHLEKTSSCIGSPCWMAPEIISQEICNNDGYDNRVDVWAVGITAIEIGEGTAPFQSMHPTRALFQIVRNPPPTLNRPWYWSDNYDDFINECLVKNPEHRPYMIELIEHPFLAEVPENNYHLSLEIKTLINDINKTDLQKICPEINVHGNLLKRGIDEEMEEMCVEDLADLKNISEKIILSELMKRFKKGEYQTFVGDILLSLNPNEKRNIFGTDFHEKYSFKSQSENAPHIYAIADSAYQNALHHMIPQRIVLSGESGSGKTRNYLHLINHLFYLGSNNNINLNRIKNAIKLIHAFTHASTPVNDYSTRCLFKTDIVFGSSGKISGATLNVHQLEKWRISSVDMSQSNFHMLYYIYDGLKSEKRLADYQLNCSREYRYLRVRKSNNSSKPRDNIEKNITKYKTILETLKEFEFTEEEINTIFTVIAAILIIGEIRFAKTDEETAAIENEDEADKVSELLKIEGSKLKWALTNYCVNCKGAVVRTKSTVDEARDARDVLANNLYSRIVDYVVSSINDKLSVGKTIFGEKYSIKLFDYFGFECFNKNHIQQLFVNTLNEQLQYHYLQRVFVWEYFDIKEEEIEYVPLNYYDNKNTLDQLLSKSEGVFTLIDQVSKMGQNGKYITEYLKNQEKKFVKIAGLMEFSVAHYPGTVTYDVKEMPDRNRDFLPPEITETLRLSDNPIIKTLFTNKLNRTGNVEIGFDKDTTNAIRFKFDSKRNASNFQYSQIKKMRTATAIFKALSLDLLKELSVGSGSGGTHFVRCIRTNLTGKRGSYDEEVIRHQLRAMTVVESAKARQRGFPHRIPFSEFLRRYQFLAFDFNENVEVTRDNCRLLLIRLKMEGWAIGKSKVFLKYYNEEYLSRLYENQVKKIIKIQSILRGFLAKCFVNKKNQGQINKRKASIKEDKKMSPEEAAAVIQRAFRESTIRKTYADFSKDYKVLDEETCNFIKTYAARWRFNSIFHVLIQYRAAKFQDMFNFAQQVHFYNLNVFHNLKTIQVNIDVESIDSNAQVTHWIGESKPSVLKIPFRLDEIPFYDTGRACDPLTNPGVASEGDDSWDTPYRWRELVSYKLSTDTTFNEINTGIYRKEKEDLINITYTRDPNETLQSLPDNEEEEKIEENNEICDENLNNDAYEEVKEITVEDDKKEISKEEKELENKSIQSSETDKGNNKIDKNTDSMNETNIINLNTKPANKDFEFIRSPQTQKPKHDPIAELRNIVRKSSLTANEDDPPFNFQGMLRKTNFQRDSIKRSADVVRTYSFTKKDDKAYKPSPKEDKENEKNVNRNAISQKKNGDTPNQKETINEKISNKDDLLTNQNEKNVNENVISQKNDKTTTDQNEIVNDKICDKNESFTEGNENKNNPKIEISTDTFISEKENINENSLIEVKSNCEEKAKIKDVFKQISLELMPGVFIEGLEIDL